MPDVYTFRRGLRTTETVNPDNIMPDIDDILYRADPTKSQLSNILDQIPGGKEPKTKKIQVRLYNSFDPLDEITAITRGTGANSETRYARLTMAQRAVRATTDDMFYQVGDTIALDNGQTVTVVMTPTNALGYALPNGGLTTSLTGNSATRTAPGDIVVRNVDNAPIRTGNIQWVQYLGHTLYEGEPVQQASVQRDVYFDANYVEHLERVMECTEDETKYIQTYGVKQDMQFQKEEMLQEIKQDVELKYMFGTRALQQDIKNQPKHFMGGILWAIRSNVSVYNPSAVTDYEKLIQDWMVNHVFRYTPNGMEKTVFCGEIAHLQFMRAFKDYRRIELTASKKMQAAGIDVTQYKLGNRTINLVDYRHFRLGTKWENWMVALDLPELEKRVKTNFTIREATLPTERVIRYAVDWEGTLACHREQCHAILRTA